MLDLRGGSVNQQKGLQGGDGDLEPSLKSAATFRNRIGEKDAALGRRHSRLWTMCSQER
jgi:hypothetical protein